MSSRFFKPSAIHGQVLRAHVRLTDDAPDAQPFEDTVGTAVEETADGSIRVRWYTECKSSPCPVAGQM